MADFVKLKPAVSSRKFPRGGPNRSEQINDTFGEIVQDLSNIYNFLNVHVIPAFNGFGRPGTYDVSATSNGIDGTTVLTDKSFADAADVHYYNSAQARPKSVKETADQFVADIDLAFRELNLIKSRLGTAIDVSDNPSTLSELETKVNFLNGLVSTIRTDNSGFLTASGIAAAIAAGTINPSSFNIADIDVIVDAAINPTKVSGIDLTAGFSYSGGVPATYDLKDSVLRLKEFVEDLTGDSLVTFAGSGLSGDSLKTHREKLGTGAESSTNPHALDVSDLTDGSNVLSREVLVGSFSFHSNGLGTDTGGFHYVEAASTVTRIAGTTALGESAGKTVGVYNYPAGGPGVLIHSGLVIPSTSPGQVTVTSFTGSTALAAGDMIYVSGVIGDALDCRVFVWGTID